MITYLVTYQNLSGEKMFVKDVSGTIVPTTSMDFATKFEGKTKKAALKKANEYIQAKPELSCWNPSACLYV